MKTEDLSFRKLAALNRKLARSRWGTLLTEGHLSVLAELARQFQFSVAMGDLILLDGRWYVTHTGPGSPPVLDFSDASCQRWAFEATVYKSRACRGFVGYGDADPSNVSSLVHGAEMRVAETRAVNRALRKAYGIGICSVEEIGSFARQPQSAPESKKLPPQPANGNGHGGRTVRDRLCQIIRQHQLDPNLVKSYATDFCGVKTLREATREQVENFVAAPGRLGRERPQCPALPAQQLPAGQKEGAA